MGYKQKAIWLGRNRVLGKSLKDCWIWLQGRWEGNFDNRNSVKLRNGVERATLTSYQAYFDCDETSYGGRPFSDSSLVSMTVVLNFLSPSSNPKSESESVKRSWVRERQKWRSFYVPLSSEEENRVLKERFISWPCSWRQHVCLSKEWASVQALLTQTVLDKRHPTHRTVAK